MRRPRREFTVFSLAAIDLFCSAMGAFMVISIVLLPYFGKKGLDNARAMQDQLARSQGLQGQVDQAQERIDALQKDNERLKDQIARSTTLALFGIVTHAQSIVVLVDLSGSIDNRKDDPRAKDFRPAVQRICNTIIDGLHPGQKLDLIGFHSPGGNPDLPVWQSAPVVVNAGIQRDAKTFVVRLLNTVSGGTPTRQALYQALAMDADAVFLITDGIPNEGQRQGADLCDEITADIKAHNHGKKEIHCIAVGDYNTEPYCVPFLMQLARDNRGQFLGQPDY